jgi:hypothetical protein
MVWTISLEAHSTHVRFARQRHERVAMMAVREESKSSSWRPRELIATTDSHQQVVVYASSEVDLICSGRQH